MVVSYWRGQFRRPQLEKLVCQGQLHRLPLYLRSRWGRAISFLSLSSAPALHSIDPYPGERGYLRSKNSGRRWLS